MITNAAVAQKSSPRHACEDRYRLLGGANAAVQAAGLNIVDMTTLEADLEDIFLQLTRRDSTGTGHAA